MSRARLLARRGGSRLVLGAPVARQQRLLHALERARRWRDRAQPLDRGHPVPLRDDEPQREAVRGRQRLPVHLVGEQDVPAHGLLDREAALVVLLDALVDAAVVGGEEELHGVVQQAGVREDPPQRRPRPLGAADGLVVPGSRDGARGEVGPPAAGALHHHRHRHGGPRAQLVEGEGQRGAHAAVDDELEGGGVEVGDVEVDEHVVHPDGRDRAAQGLERHARVAQREPDFVTGEPGVVRDRHGVMLLRRARGRQCRARLDLREHVVRD